MSVFGLFLHKSRRVLRSRRIRIIASGIIVVEIILAVLHFSNRKYEDILYLKKNTEKIIIVLETYARENIL